MITITFTNNINNDSLQIGDLAYFASAPSSVGGFNQSGSAPILIGDITNITLNSVVINNTGTNPNPTDFIMFAKDSSVNISGLVGYFAEVELRNNSTEKAEIFAISSGISVSSK